MITTEDLVFGIVLSIVLAAPLCISVVLAFRWHRKPPGKTQNGMLFWRLFIYSLVLIMGLATFVNVIGAAKSGSGGNWAIATCNEVGYSLVLPPFCALIAGVLSRLFHAFKRI